MIEETVVVVVRPTNATKDEPALVLEAKAQLIVEPVPVHDVDWIIQGTLMLNVWNKMAVFAEFSHSIPIELPTIDALVIPLPPTDCDVAKTIAGENVEPALND